MPCGRSASASPRSSSASRAGRGPRSTSRSPTCRCASCSASGSGCRSSSTTTPTLAALAEAHEDGEIAGRPNLVMLTVGTGVGGGLVLDGPIYRGATGAAAELGHMLIGVDLAAGVPEAGGFPQAGSLETFAAGSALDRLADARGREHPESYLGERAAGGGEITGATRSRGAGRATRPRSGCSSSSASGSGSGSPTRSTRSIPRSSRSAAASRPRVSCCSSRPVAWPRRTCCPASGSGPRSASPGMARRPGVLGAALLAKMETRPTKQEGGADERRRDRDPNSTSSRSTRSGRCRWTPSRRPTRATRGRRWASRRSATSSTRGSCATTR